MPEAPDAIVLCGGLGLRLRSIIGNAPKGMAEVAGRPFLEMLLRQLARYGLQRVILAAGYQNDAIQSHFDGVAFGMQLIYSVESSPLGTGGALRKAADLVRSTNILVMNGDSHTDADLCSFMADHCASQADVSIVVVPTNGRSDAGCVRVDTSSRLIRFDEKAGSGDAPYINAGIYMLSRSQLFDIPARVQISLERELFPRWLDEQKDIRAFVHAGNCVDIGTPERFHEAQNLLADVEKHLCTRAEVNHQ